jgi:hypothetical protein
VLVLGLTTTSLSYRWYLQQVQVLVIGLATAVFDAPNIVQSVSHPAAMLAGASSLPWAQLLYTGVVTTAGCLWLEVHLRPSLSQVI